MRQRIEAAAHRRIINALVDFCKMKCTYAQHLVHFHEILSASPHLDLQFVLDHPEMLWCWKAMSPTVIMNWSDVLKHLDKPWHWPTLSRNPSIRMPLVIRTIDLPWDWDELSRNPGIFFSDILEFPDLPWNWDNICCNPNITMDIVLANLNMPWTKSLCANANITLRHVRAHPDLLLHLDMLSFNPNINMRFVNEQSEKSNSNSSWRWSALSANPAITMVDVEDYINRPWDINAMSRNPNLTFKFVKRHFNAAWRWDQVARNIHATPAQVNSFPAVDDPEKRRIPWVDHNPENRRISWVDHSDKPKKRCISWVDYSNNPNLALTDVFEQPDLPWRYSGLLRNPLTADYWRVFVQCARRHLSALKIQRLWRMVSTDPNHDIGRRIQYARIKQF